MSGHAQTASRTTAVDSTDLAPAVVREVLTVGAFHLSPEGVSGPGAAASDLLYGSGASAVGAGVSLAAASQDRGSTLAVRRPEFLGTFSPFAHRASARSSGSHEGREEVAPTLPPTPEIGDGGRLSQADRANSTSVSGGC